MKRSNEIECYIKLKLIDLTVTKTLAYWAHSYEEKLSVANAGPNRFLGTHIYETSLSSKLTIGPNKLN
jgi:hypothetical protein